MRESYIEKKVCEWAREQGIIVVKIATIGGAQRGVPDRLFLKNGKAVWIEFKAPGRKPTKLQERWVRRLTSECFSVTYVDSVQEGITFLSTSLKDAP